MDSMDDGYDGTYYHGSNGASYTKYNYPGTYADWDFHSCHTDINNYGDAGNVQNCELAGLSDLNTGSAYVRGKIAGYLISLANMGVRGFRIDAVKHISPTDMAAIVDQVNAAINPDPYYFQEVIDGGGEAVHASDYFGVSGGQADVTEFKYQDKLSKKFLNATYPGGYEKLAELSSLKAHEDTRIEAKLRVTSCAFVDSLSYPQPHAIAEIPWHNRIAKHTLGGLTQAGQADLLLADAVLEQCRDATLAAHEANQPLGAALLDIVEHNFFGEAKALAGANTLQVLAFVP